MSRASKLLLVVVVSTMPAVGCPATPAIATVASCPSYAFEAKTLLVDWDRIKSDNDAVACMHAAASQLGPEGTRRLLDGLGFNAVFIRPFASRRTLLSATWPIHDKGLLYTPGLLQGAVTRFRAYSQVFSFSWSEDGRLRVSQSYTFE